jgi:hypothetical protein
MELTLLRGSAGETACPVTPVNLRRASRLPLGLDMEYVKLGVHIWVSVLIMGTLWRVLTYHLIANQNQSLQHLGRAMAQQY